MHPLPADLRAYTCTPLCMPNAYTAWTQSDKPVAAFEAFAILSASSEGSSMKGFRSAIIFALILNGSNDFKRGMNAFVFANIFFAVA